MEEPYLDEAIDNVWRAGIMVSTIYTAGLGHFGHGYRQTYWAQIYLSQLADETGGEAYSIGLTGPPCRSLHFSGTCENGWRSSTLLSFLAEPSKKADWQRIRLMTEIPNADLVGAGKSVADLLKRSTIEKDI